jgi:hypothetical protein
MKVFKALASGFCKTVKAWKGILLIWVGSLLTVSLVAIPFKAFLQSALGGSMITERLKDGIDIEVLGDIGSGFRNLMSSLPAGLFMLILTGILLGAFLNGGIFDSLKASGGKFSFSGFFRASSKNFWPFLLISVIVNAMIYFISVIIIGLPLVIAVNGGSGSEKIPMITAALSFSLFFLLSMLFILTADYARAWHAAQDRQAPFKALGFGFSRTFGTFLSSFPMMLLLSLVITLFTFLVMKVMTGWIPSSGGGVFLLFIISQLLFFVKSALKVWRYGSVTALKELNDNKDKTTTEIINQPVLA